jgi:hypothetical protein
MIRPIARLRCGPAATAVLAGTALWMAPLPLVAEPAGSDLPRFVDGSRLPPPELPHFLDVSRLPLLSGPAPLAADRTRDALPATEEARAEPDAAERAAETPAPIEPAAIVIAPATAAAATVGDAGPTAEVPARVEPRHSRTKPVAGSARRVRPASKAEIEKPSKRRQPETPRKSHEGRTASPGTGRDGSRGRVSESPPLRSDLGRPPETAPAQRSAEKGEEPGFFGRWFGFGSRGSSEGPASPCFGTSQTGRGNCSSTRPDDED